MQKEYISKFSKKTNGNINAKGNYEYRTSRTKNGTRTFKILVSIHLSVKPNLQFKDIQNSPLTSHSNNYNAPLSSTKPDTFFDPNQIGYPEQAHNPQNYNPYGGMQNPQINYGNEMNNPPFGMNNLNEIHGPQINNGHYGPPSNTLNHYGNNPYS